MCVFMRLFVLLCFVYAMPLAAGAKPSVWSLDGPRGTLILLGSIHVGESSFYPFEPKVEQAFESAQALVVELDSTVLTLEETRRVTRELGMFNAQQLQDGQGLSSVLNTKAQLALQKFCQGDNKAVCPPAAQMESLQPWFLALHFSNAMLARSDYDARYGVDAYFLQRAKAKPIFELESFTQQMQTFGALDTETQSTFLSQTLAEFDASSDMIRQMVSAWRAGNDIELESLILAPMASTPESAAIYDALFLKRNVAMVEKLLQQARVGETLFVVVGAGHLLGEYGLVSLLEAQGFKASKF